MSAEGVLLPPQILRFMGESDDSFLPVSDHLCNNVLASVDGKAFDVLDVGCGYGRLAYGLRRAGFRGSYRGFDILNEHVTWLQEHFSTPEDGERYRFDFLNVHNSRYNPGGLPFDDISLPYAERSFDCITTLSVFTHMYEEDMRQYLRRIGALLRKGGVWVATFFSLPDDFSMASQRSGAYQLVEQISEHAFIHNPAEPLHVIAFKKAFLYSMFAEEGLTVESRRNSRWSGDTSAIELQDWFVLRKQGAAAPAAQAEAKQTPAPSVQPAATKAPAIETPAPVPEPAAPCNICGGTTFRTGPAGRAASNGAMPCCAKCGALERQRVVRHIFQALPVGFLDWRRTLQFSPDQAQNPTWYRSFDVSVYGGKDSLDIQAIALSDASYDFITLSHVLECIPDDLAAFDELHRVLSPRGLLHIGFAAAQSRATTQDFDNPVDFYQNRHLYGRDVYQRFGCAARGMGMLAVEGTDPVTRTRDVAHLFFRHAPDVAQVRIWLGAWNGALTIVDEVMP